MIKKFSGASILGLKMEKDVERELTGHKKLHLTFIEGAKLWLIINFSFLTSCWLK